MTTILNIDASSHAQKPYIHREHQPAEDFSQELPKHDDSADVGLKNQSKANPQELPAHDAPVVDALESPPKTHVQPKLESASGLALQQTQTSAPQQGRTPVLQQAPTLALQQGRTSVLQQAPTPVLHQVIVPDTTIVPGNSKIDVVAPVERVIPPITVSQVQQTAQVTVTAKGMTEILLRARVFGWHAMAQAYLSELAFADAHEAMHAEPWAPSAFGASTKNETEAPAPEGMSPTGSMVEASSPAAPSVEPLPQMLRRLSSDSSASAETTELAALDGGASSYWLERSLRFTQQKDGSRVAWLRDFRIGGAEASHLIQVVLNDAKASGVNVSKIMLNGREAWTSPQNHQGVHDVG